MADAKMLRRERMRQRFAKLPTAMRADVGAQLKTEVDDLVAAQRRAAPVDKTAKEPGQFRDSIHAYPNPDRELSFRIIADAKDENGDPIGGKIEHGHRARDGTHVAAVPSFFPTYRARKKGMKRRVAAAGRKSVKRLFPSE